MERLIPEALFPDDCAHMAHKESQLHFSFNKFAEASRLFYLTINLRNTKVLHQPAPVTAAPAPSVSIDDTQLKVVEKFK